MKKELHSLVGLGTVKFGRNTGVKYPENFELPSLEALQKLINQCRSIGINLLDTAPAYGQSEALLGNLLEGERDNWILGTKVGEQYSNQQSIFDFTRNGAQVSLARSCQLLKTDYLDYVQLHSAGDDVEALESEATEYLLQLKSAGSVGMVGASVKTAEGIALVEKLNLDLCMLEINMDHPEFVTKAKQLRARGVKVLIKKSLSSGHLDPKVALSWLKQQNCFDAVILGSLNFHHINMNKDLLDAA